MSKNSCSQPDPTVKKALFSLEQRNVGLWILRTTIPAQAIEALPRLQSSKQCQVAAWGDHKPICRLGNSTRANLGSMQEAALTGSKKYIGQYYARVLARTLSLLSAAVGIPRKGEQMQSYIKRVHEFSRANVVEITVRIKKGSAPEYHHRDLYYVKNSARFAPTALYSPTTVREAFIASHNTLKTFGFATVIQVQTQDGELLVWWSKTDTIPFAALLGILDGNAEDELARCGWRD
ncbi:hypothetical protein BT96DRAFT_943486 [Gymnopus androsaceus JB14]|uniref:Uncharacterized protein n=1 Tax=Gymnopus androsaceus JB14 TaxID=1447944 RepID=A0A6A4HA74_9AGAR|nr:hypothetical protein BT96DRAFT_943486 [Gymnopus androsaceus JB14]